MNRAHRDEALCGLDLSLGVLRSTMIRTAGLLDWCCRGAPAIPAPSGGEQLRNQTAFAYGLTGMRNDFVCRMLKQLGYRNGDRGGGYTAC